MILINWEENYGENYGKKIKIYKLLIKWQKNIKTLIMDNNSFNFSINNNV